MTPDQFRATFWRIAAVSLLIFWVALGFGCRGGGPMTGRGYFGIGIVNGKTKANLGTLWRAAHLYEATFIFTVGRRYERQASDTPNTPRHTPLFEFATTDDLLGHLPYGCPLVGVEMDPRAVPLSEFQHPERACYLLGAEDHGLPVAVTDRCHLITQVETPRPQSMNVAVAGSLVMHDRFLKSRLIAAVEVAS